MVEVGVEGEGEGEVEVEKVEKVEGVLQHIWLKVLLNGERVKIILMMKKKVDESGHGVFNYLKSFFMRVDRTQVGKNRINNSPNASLSDLYGNGNDKKNLKKKFKEDEEDILKKVDYKHQILNYDIKGNGSNVSGGMKQSIALSRVFLRKGSKIVICDESFNSMDMVKKNTLIYPALFEFIKKYNMTLIMISHDILECFMDLDHVVVLENGIVHCQGTHKELVENEKLYKKLCGHK
eukprot:232328_1